MTIIPYYFQTEAKNALFNYLCNGGTGNPLICMPTGTGKSVVLADCIKDIFTYWPTKRLLLLTHVGKLIEQNAAKLQAFWPNAPIGIHSDGLKKRDTTMPIIFGGIQSVVSNIESFGRRDIIFIDEAHLLSDDDESMYLKTIAVLKGINPDLVVCGLTATAYRLKMGSLLQGGIFTDICYDITTPEWFARLVKEGYLCKLVGKPTTHKIQGLDKLKIVDGEFNSKQAENIIDTDDNIYPAVQELLELGYHRNRCMIFAAGIKNAEHIAQVMDYYGASCTFVHSKLKSAENERRIELHRRGEVWALIGANKLTTGYDDPEIDIIGDFQPTKSPSKHVQKLGRGTRIHPSKINTLIADFVGNIERNGPIDEPRLPRPPGEGGGDAPIKICTTDKLLQNAERSLIGCNEYNRAAARYCCQCSLEFSFESKVEATAFTHSPMKEEDKPIVEFFNLTKPVLYRKNEGRDKGNGIISPPVAKVTYILGIRPIHVHLCFEHTGYPRRLAHQWWQRHSPNEVPLTVDEFLFRTNELRIPKVLTVHTNLKYPEVIGYEF